MQELKQKKPVYCVSHGAARKDEQSMQIKGTSVLDEVYLLTVTRESGSVNRLPQGSELVVRGEEIRRRLFLGTMRQENVGKTVLTKEKLARVDRFESFRLLQRTMRKVFVYKRFG